MKKIILSTLMLGAFSAFANEAADDRANRAAHQGQLSRDQVRAEFIAAKAGGSLADTSETGSMKSQGVSESRDRGGLRAEAIEAARTRVVHELM